MTAFTVERGAVGSIQSQKNPNVTDATASRIDRRTLAARFLAATSALAFRPDAFGDEACVFAAGRETELEIRVHGRPRYATCYVPSRYDARFAWPLVLAFHPFLQPNRSWERYVRLKHAAERHGFLLVLPRGSGWLAFRTFRHDPGSQPKKPDDYAFVAAILESLGSRLSFDRSRIYAIGHSNGGMFGHSLAATHPGLLAGLVAVSGLPSAVLTNNVAPLPVMIVHGTSDNITPWTGPSLMTPRFARFVDLDSTLSQWLRINGATIEPKISAYDRPGDQTRILRFDWPAPPAMAETVLLKIENGGHRWPDPQSKIYFPFTGEQSQDIDMLDVAWEFLSRQRLG
jgi:polyhydroxybutyrate depolymerase